jgi:glycosyltransferase involved in cell wall biosynthesis
MTGRLGGLRVCMVVHAYYYRDTRVRRYVDTIVAAGGRVDVLCLRDQDGPRGQGRGDARVITIPVGRGANGFWGYVREYASAFVLFSVRTLGLHIRNRYDVIHVHNMPDFLVFAALVPKLLGARVILDIHDAMPEFYMSKFSLEGKSAIIRLLRLQERLAAGVADAVITANAAFGDRIAARGVRESKVVVVNNYPDTGLFDRRRHDGKRRGRGQGFDLLYPGTIAPRYGLDVAIAALPMLVGTIPKLRLVIVGRQVEYTRELCELAIELGVRPFVEFRHPVRVDEVPGLMAGADIGIYPARPDAHMNVAMPVKVLEYAAMGIPIVASRIKVLESVFDESSIMFFEPGNVLQFAECVEEVFNRPGLGAKLARNAGKIVTGALCWRSESQRYLDLLDQLRGPRVLRAPAG